MSDCCVEEGMLQALRALECTPIPAQQHFVGVRRGEECLPYLVIKTREQAGLRTSSFLEMVTAVEISAYFSTDSSADSASFRRLLSQWLFGSNCLSLGNCGCFCVRSIGSVTTDYRERAIQVSVTISGRITTNGESSSSG